MYPLDLLCIGAGIEDLRSFLLAILLNHRSLDLSALLRQWHLSLLASNWGRTPGEGGKPDACPSRSRSRCVAI